MSQQASRRLGRAALVATLIAGSAWVLADDRPSSAQPKGSAPGKTAGVIVKVEPLEQGDQANHRSWKVTVNTDVVWRDFVRDQAVAPAKAAQTGTGKAAAKGKKSVATEGHPRDSGMLATANLDSKTEITIRYRSSTDEISEGAERPEGASRAENATDSSSKTTTAGRPVAPGARTQALKARVLQPIELKPGLWVDIEYQNGDKENLARRVMVIQPVGGPDTSPDKEKGPAGGQTNPGR